MRLFPALLLSCSSAWAQIDLDRACLDCHGSGPGRADIPLIEGQDRNYLMAQLRDFRSLHREGFPMSALAAGLDDAEIAALAGALAKAAFTPDRSAVLARAAARGRAIAQSLGCASCHGEAYGGGEGLPRLAGQRRGALSLQLGRIAERGRHPRSLGEEAEALALGAGEVRALAAYLHALGQRELAEVDPNE